MKPSRLFPRLIAAVLIVAVAVSLPFILSQQRAANQGGGKLNIVAGENFWGNIAAQIGGSRVNVTSIISDPNADPHLYESDAQDAAAIGSADLVIENGLGYDDFMNKLVSASNNNDRQVLVASKIVGASGQDSNPHIWYDIPRVPLVASEIAKSLEAKDPGNKAVYQSNLASFDASLKPLEDVMATIKQRYSGVQVAYTEPVPGYLLADLSLTVSTPDAFARAIEDGNDPTPADNATMQRLMTSKSVRVLLYNSQATSPVTQNIRNLAQQNGIPVVGVTETLPSSAKTYQAWQLDQLQTLLNALGR